MKFLNAIALVLTAFLSLNVAARSPAPIINYENIVVTTGSGKSLISEQVNQAIVTAAGVKNWTIAFQTEETLQATLNVSGKHTIVIEVTYSADKYSLLYKESTNMKYGVRHGQPVIHPHYNKWVQDFRSTIRTELLKL